VAVALAPSIPQHHGWMKEHGRSRVPATAGLGSADSRPCETPADLRYVRLRSEIAAAPRACCAQSDLNTHPLPRQHGSRRKSPEKSQRLVADFLQRQSADDGVGLSNPTSDRRHVYEMTARMRRTRPGWSSADVAVGTIM